MIDGETINIFGSSLVTSGGVLGVAIYLMRQKQNEQDRQQADMLNQFKACQDRCNARREDDEKHFGRIELDIMKALSEIQVQIARIETGGNVAKELAKEIANAIKEVKK